MAEIAPRPTVESSDRSPQAERPRDRTRPTGYVGPRGRGQVPDEFTSPSIRAKATSDPTPIHDADTPRALARFLNLAAPAQKLASADRGRTFRSKQAASAR